jgi:hypothetical protein
VLEERVEEVVVVDELLRPGSERENVVVHASPNIVLRSPTHVTHPGANVEVNPSPGGQIG